MIVFPPHNLLFFSLSSRIFLLSSSVNITSAAIVNKLRLVLALSPWGQNIFRYKLTHQKQVNQLHISWVTLVKVSAGFDAIFTLLFIN